MAHDDGDLLRAVRARAQYGAERYARHAYAAYVSYRGGDVRDRARRSRASRKPAALLSPRESELSETDRGGAGKARRTEWSGRCSRPTIGARMGRSRAGAD